MQTNMIAGFARGTASGIGRALIRAGVGLPVLFLIGFAAIHNGTGVAAFAIVSVLVIRTALKVDAAVQIPTNRGV